MSTMSPSASLTLPPVTMSGEYIMEDHESHSDQGWAPDDFPAKQGNYLQGNYLRCLAEVKLCRKSLFPYFKCFSARIVNRCVCCPLWWTDWIIWAQLNHRPPQPSGVSAESLHERSQWSHSESFRCCHLTCATDTLSFFSSLVPSLCCWPSFCHKSLKLIIS